MARLLPVLLRGARRIPGTSRMSAGPPPVTWYAMLSSPLAAYEIGSPRCRAAAAASATGGSAPTRRNLELWSRTLGRNEVGGVVVPRSNPREELGDEVSRASRSPACACVRGWCAARQPERTATPARLRARAPLAGTPPASASSQQLSAQPSQLGGEEEGCARGSPGLECLVDGGERLVAPCRSGRHRRRGGRGRTRRPSVPRGGAQAADAGADLGDAACGIAVRRPGPAVDHAGHRPPVGEARARRPPRSRRPTTRRVSAHVAAAAARRPTPAPARPRGHGSAIRRSTPRSPARRAPSLRSG